MKRISQRTYYFWIVTRVIIILFGAFDVCSLISKFGISLLYVVQSVYIVLNIIILYRELLKISPSIMLKYLVGTLSICIGLGVFYWKFTEPKVTWGSASYQFDYTRLFCYVLSGWFIAFGLFDFLKFNRLADE